MNHQIQKLASSKLFYNKWAFKIACRLDGASRIIRVGPDQIRTWCLSTKPIPMFNRWDKTRVDKVELLAFTNAVEPFLNKKDIVQIRAEHNHFNLFCSDKAVLENIDNSLSKWIKTISGPTTDEELEFLVSNGHTKVLCSAIPKEKFKYKLYFKTNFNASKRQSFLTWIENYGDKVDISPTSKLWLSGSLPYAQRPFMYVTDDKVLGMVGLFLSGDIQRVEEFIPRNSVLTV